LIEPPDLSLVTVCSLDNHVSAVDNFEVSLRSHSRLDEEWSFDVKSKLFIELSLSWFTLPLIGIKDIPLLSKSVVWLLVDSDVFAFNILVVEDRQGCFLTFQTIDDSKIFDSVLLPPS